MSLTKRVYHIDGGPTDMYPVDAANAVGSHPHEWSLVPWTDEAKAAARPHLEKRAKQQEEAAKRGVPNTLIDGNNLIGAQTSPDQAPPPLETQGGQTGDPKTNAEVVKRLQGDLDMAQADLDKATADLDAAKGKNDDKAAQKAQAAVDQAKARRDEAQAKVDAAKKP